MLRVMPHRTTLATFFLAAIAVFAAIVWYFAYSEGLNRLSERGQSELALATDRLANQLQRYREVAVLLDDHPTITGLLTGEVSDPATVAAILLDRADRTGLAGLLLVDGQGQVLAASGDVVLPDGARAAVERAHEGALGAGHYLTGEGGRGYAYAAPVFGPDGKPTGAVVALVDIAVIEWNWPASPSAVYFTDQTGRIMVTNRSDLVLVPRGSGPLDGSVEVFDGHTLLHLDPSPYLPTDAMVLRRDVPVIGLTGEILMDMTQVRSLAALQAGIAATLSLAFGAFLYLATARRRALAEANRQLEANVAARTAQLEHANYALRREVSERMEAEARLKRAQADLVQAGKLSALGEMSAGISHELNQPLMAIRSFAENAEAFLDRGKPEKAAENLSRISDLARRMGRIIKNLRAFARQESEPITDVDIAAAVDVVLEIAEPKIRAAQVAVFWPRPNDPVWVRGGEVRLQQVVMNLVSNAVDAMQDADTRQLWLRLDRSGDRVRLTVRDSGPGIAQPDKIFDPFYSTKEVGASEGMGLGLSISYGLVQSFGGAIRGRNHDEGGAEFTVDLTAARREEAA